jgi:hypothetical protein
VIKRPLFALPLVLLACAKDAPPPERTATAPATSAASTAAAPVRLGEPISGAAVALTDVAANPSAYRGKPLVTTGTVTAVCQEMGCWMEIKDDRGQAHIRMHGHSFFVPKTASGHHAKVEATLVDANDKTECDEEGKATSTPGAQLARVELDATGVELE